MSTCSPKFQAAGTAPISFTSSILESKALGDQEEFDLKWSAASLYSGTCLRSSCCVDANLSTLVGAADTVRIIHVPLPSQR